MNLPVYKEITIDQGIPRFHCIVTIDGAKSFGSVDPMSPNFVTFSSKKSAKQYAAQQAVNWLTSNQLTSAAAIVSGEPVRPVEPLEPVRVVQQPPKPATPIISRPGSPPYTARIPNLSVQLGLQPPTYFLVPAADIPNCPLWDGYADFAGDPRIGDEGKVGHIKSITGKKQAKEAIARQVYTFLKGIEADRLKSYEEEDKKRKRPPSSSQQSETAGTSNEM
jgi:hypothetical protein